jgi:hypothetical protein
MFHRRIEVRAGRGRIRRRAIAFFVNVETVFARREILNIGDDLNVIANLGEGDRAGDFAVGLSFSCRKRTCAYEKLYIYVEVGRAEGRRIASIEQALLDSSVSIDAPVA